MLGSRLKSSDNANVYVCVSSCMRSNGDAGGQGRADEIQFKLIFVLTISEMVNLNTGIKYKIAFAKGSKGRGERERASESE
jgi:hypothetical protein